ncbi:MAG: M13 family peptidase [Bacteroidetes bacterium]|nr:M13 family peptidase [Bacteroidota bacterium]
MKNASKLWLASAVILGGMALSAWNMIEEKKGYNLENLDTEANPCTDFYEYAIGGWKKANPMPATDSRWGVFNVLSKQNQDHIEGILENLLKTKKAYPANSPEQQVRDFYLASLDSAARNARGIEPVKKYLEAIEMADSKEKLLKTIATWRPVGMGTFFSLYVDSDAKESGMNRLHLGQSGLHLPDRDYYLKEDSSSRMIRESYGQHLRTMFSYIDNPENVESAALDVIELEKQLAEISMSRTERRDPDKRYNKYSRQEFEAAFAGFDWKSYFELAQVPEWEDIIVEQVTYLKEAIALWNERPLKVWKAYYKWEVLSNNSGVLSLDIEASQFAFYSGVLRGTQEMKPFSERAVRKVNGNLGELVGELFVKQYFSEDSKKKVSQMVEEIREVFRDRIMNLTWMSDTTKEKAMEKLNAFTYKIGYPDKWRDYSTLNIKPKNLFENEEAIAEFTYKRMMDKLGKPVDKSEWGMTPQTVNAYYNASNNEIVFPAGILQPPFYDPNADDALNYGGIGGVIGHEFSHGFDDKGSKFDAVGNLNDWWTANDRNRFNKLTGMIVAQFDGFEVLPGIHINGSLTQGENIADLAGVTLAYHALEKHYGDHPPKGKGSDGFTWQQRFFLGWAQVWAQNITEKELRTRIITDPHSPGQYRVLGPLSNLQEFWNAFDCKDGSPMVQKDPEKRVVIW